MAIKFLDIDKDINFKEIQAFTAAGKSTSPNDVRVLGNADGFPDLPFIAITLLESNNASSQAVDALANYVTESFGELRHLIKNAVPY